VFAWGNSLGHWYPQSILLLNITEQNANSCGPMAKKRKYVKKSKFKELEDVLKEWFENVRLSNLQVSAAVLQEKAMHIARK
jgi:hypothetical protein